jgi:hypothetical protein
MPDACLASVPNGSYLSLMRLATLIAAIVLLSSSDASALCLSAPDDASTGYTSNQTAHTVCLQQELAASTSRAAEQARIDAALGNIQIELDRQRQLITQQQAQPHWPQLPL